MELGKLERGENIFSSCRWRGAYNVHISSIRKIYEAYHLQTEMKGNVKEK